MTDRETGEGLSRAKSEIDAHLHGQALELHKLLGLLIETGNLPKALKAAEKVYGVLELRVALKTSDNEVGQFLTSCGAMSRNIMTRDGQNGNGRNSYSGVFNNGNGSDYRMSLPELLVYEGWTHAAKKFLLERAFDIRADNAGLAYPSRDQLREAAFASVLRGYRFRGLEEEGYRNTTTEMQRHLAELSEEWHRVRALAPKERTLGWDRFFAYRIEKNPVLNSTNDTELLRVLNREPDAVEALNARLLQFSQMGNLVEVGIVSPVGEGEDVDVVVEEVTIAIEPDSVEDLTGAEQPSVVQAVDILEPSEIPTKKERKRKENKVDDVVKSNGSKNKPFSKKRK